MPKIFTQHWNNSQGEEYQVLLFPYECYAVGNEDPAQGIDDKTLELKYVEPAKAAEYDFLPLDLEMINLLIQ